MAGYGVQGSIVGPIGNGKSPYILQQAVRPRTASSLAA